MVRRHDPVAMASFARTEAFLLGVAKGEIVPVLPPPKREKRPSRRKADVPQTPDRPVLTL
jgi:hypothetical protein